MDKTNFVTYICRNTLHGRSEKCWGRRVRHVSGGEMWCIGDGSVGHRGKGCDTLERPSVYEMNFKVFSRILRFSSKHPEVLVP